MLSQPQRRSILGGDAAQHTAILGAAAVRVPGSCGELVQGLLEGGYFLISCPVDFFATVSVEIFAGEESAGGPGVDAPESCPKTAAAVKATLTHLGRGDLRVHVSVNNPIPRSKGLGSSSVRNRSRQAPIRQHALHVQILDRYARIVFRQVGREFVQGVLANAADSVM